MENKINYDSSFFWSIKSISNFSDNDIKNFMECLYSKIIDYVKYLTFLDTKKFTVEMYGFSEYTIPYVRILIITDNKTYSYKKDFVTLLNDSESPVSTLDSGIITGISSIKNYFDTIFKNLKQTRVVIHDFYYDFVSILDSPSFIYGKFNELKINYKDSFIMLEKKDGKIIVKCNISKRDKGYVGRILKFIKNIEIQDDFSEILFYGIENCDIVKNETGVIIKDNNNPFLMEGVSEISNYLIYDFTYRSRFVRCEIKDIEIIDFYLSDGKYSFSIENKELGYFKLSDKLLNCILRFNDVFDFNKYIPIKDVSDIYIHNSDIFEYNILNGRKTLSFSDEENIIFLSKLSRKITDLYEIEENYIVSPNTVCIVKWNNYIINSLSECFRHCIFSKENTFKEFSDITYRMTFYDGVIEKKGENIIITYDSTLEDVASDEGSLFDTLKKALSELNKDVVIYDKFNEYLYITNCNIIYKYDWYNDKLKIYDKDVNKNGC